METSFGKNKGANWTGQKFLIRFFEKELNKETENASNSSQAMATKFRLRGFKEPLLVN